VRLLYIDHVTRLRRADSIEATLLLSPDEPIFSVHFPGNPMLPASLLIECLAQAATILIEASTEFTRKAFPATIRDAKFRRAIRPPHPLFVRVSVTQWAEEGALLQCQATQDDKVCAVCTLGMMTAPLHEFYGPEHAAAYRAMYTSWLDGAALEGFETHPLDPLRHVLVP